MADEMNKEREAVARAIWALMREHEDRCDQELEDLEPSHPIWAYADAARASLAASAGSEPVATIKSWTNGSYWRNYKVEWHRNDLPEGAQLYTHPSPLEGAGTVSVPKEPTAEMKLAAQKADMDHSDHEEWLHENWPDFKRVWDAMIAAAPPASEAKGAT